MIGDNLKSIKIKYAISIVTLVAIVVILCVTGITKADTDDSKGMLIDFGYWDAKWIEMSFTEDMDGMTALEVACEMQGYAIEYDDKGGIKSINGQKALPNMPWNLYKIEDNAWKLVEDPKSLKASDENILCWARASGADEVITATDYSGHLYFGYASGGISKKTGLPIKVVTLAPSITEIVCSLGGTDNIIGTDVYSDYPDIITERKQKGLISEAGGYTDPSYELIVRMNPDLVFCDGSVESQVNMADKLRKSGIACCVLFDSTDINALYSNIWVVSASLGYTDTGVDEIKKIKRVIDDVAGIAGVTNIRTFITMSTDPSPWTAGSDTYINDIIVTDGGINVFSDYPSWYMVSKETIYGKQPGLIIIMMANKITNEDEYKALLNGMDPVWKETPAYKDGRIYVFSGDANDVLSRPGPRLAEAAELIAKALNPEAFRDEDPKDEMPKFVEDNYRDFLKYQEA